MNLKLFARQSQAVLRPGVVDKPLSTAERGMNGQSTAPFFAMHLQFMGEPVSASLVQMLIIRTAFKGTAICPEVCKNVSPLQALLAGIHVRNALV